jgi:hypothetical protein
MVNAATARRRGTLAGLGRGPELRPWFLLSDYLDV